MNHVEDTRQYKDVINDGGILYIGRDRFGASRAVQFGLRKNGHNIMVQVQYRGPLEREHSEGLTVQRMEYLLEREFEVVTSVLRRIEFGRANWVYVVRDGNDYRLVYKHRPPPVFITLAHEWAPRVDHREIEVHRWWSYDEGEGLWEGKPVRFRYAWCDHTDGNVDIYAEMHAYYLLRDLDVTFPVLGLVTVDGDVTGFMYELPVGRRPTYRDRALVYEAIAKIQRHGILHRQLHWWNIIISPEDKVRFWFLEWAIAPYHDDLGKLEDRADHYHWGRLKYIFEELKEFHEDYVWPVERKSDTWLLDPQLFYKIPDSFWAVVVQPWPVLMEVGRRWMSDVAKEFTIKSQSSKDIARRKERVLLLAAPESEEESGGSQVKIARRKPGIFSVGLTDMKVKPISLNRKSKKKLLAPSFQEFINHANQFKEMTQTTESDASRFEEIFD